MTIYLYLISIITVIFFAGTIVGLLSNITPKKLFFIVSSIIVLVSLILLAYSTYAAPIDDLSRYYADLDSMKAHGSYVSIYKNTPVINYLFYLVAISGFNGLLPATVIAIIFAIIFSVTYNYTFKNKATIYMISLYYMVVLSMAPLRYTISGIRNTLAFSILFLGIYIFYKSDIKNKYVKWGLGVFCYIVAAMIHTSTYIVLAILIISSIKYLYKFRYLMLVFVAGLQPVLFLLSKTGNPMINHFYYKLMINIGSKTILLKIQIIYFILLLIFLYMVNVVKKHNKDDNYKKYKGYYVLFEYLILATIGSAYVPTIFSRMCIIISMLALPVIVQYTREIPIYKIKWLKLNLKINKTIILYFILCMGMYLFEAYDAYLNWSLVR